jgi:hypothetical protein
MRHTKLGHEDEPLQEMKNLQVRKMRMIVRRIFDDPARSLWP